jgi:hypothetical protein
MIWPSFGNHFECITIGPQLNKEVQIFCFFHRICEPGEADKVIIDKPLYLFLLPVDNNGNQISFEDVEALQFGGSLIDDFFISAIAIVHHSIYITTVHIRLGSQVCP